MKRICIPVLAIMLCGISFAQEAGPIEIGKAAPDFSVTGIDGESFKLSERLENGKNIILLFSRAHW